MAWQGGGPWATGRHRVVLGDSKRHSKAMGASLVLPAPAHPHTSCCPWAPAHPLLQVARSVTRALSLVPPPPLLVTGAPPRAFSPTLSATWSTRRSWMWSSRGAKRRGGRGAGRRRTCWGGARGSAVCSVCVEALQRAACPPRPVLPTCLPATLHACVQGPGRHGGAHHCQLSTYRWVGKRGRTGVRGFRFEPQLTPVAQSSLPPPCRRDWRWQDLCAPRGRHRAHVRLSWR